MRTNEFIIENSVSGFELKYTHHFLDRLRERNIPIALINTILKRIGRAKRQINDIGVEKSVAVYDSREGVHLIVKKKDETSNELQLITAYRNDDYHGKTPVIQIR